MNPPTTSDNSGLLARTAKVAMGHRRLVALGWVVLLVGVFVISGATGTHYSQNFSLKGTDSQRAVDLLKAKFPTQSGDQDQVVFAVHRSSIKAPAIRARVSSVLDRIAHVPNVAGVSSPYNRSVGNAISTDGRNAFATVNFDQRANTLPKSSTDRVISIAQGARSATLQVELGGQAIEQAQRASLGAATAIGLLAAIIVLLITFGSFVAMGLPIITALLGLGTGVALIGIGTNLIAMPDFSTQLAVMIGLGVGIDYSLFIVTRFRENYLRGGDVEGSVIASMDTAGRAVLFAGATVIIALMGMFALGVGFLYGLAIAASIAVLMTMLAALTMLPVLLSRFGQRIGRRSRRSRQTAAAAKPEKATFWSRWAGLIQRHPWPAAVAGLGIMLVLAAPALSMRLASSDAGNDPTNLTTRRAYDLLAEGFGKGFNGPLQVVAAFNGPQPHAALARIRASLARTPDVRSVGDPMLSPKGGTAVFQVYPGSAPQDAATTNLVNRLRSDELPPLARSTGTTLLVGGQTATGVDFSHVLGNKLPLFIGIVVLLSALLLLVVFRSLVIPLQAAVMNLLSIGASLGVVVAIFQKGWLGGLLGVQSGPIDAFIPVLLFAIVFGLSMDYEVFLVSRIHEEWVRRRDPSQAVVEGVASTGRVITAARRSWSASFSPSCSGTNGC